MPDSAGYLPPVVAQITGDAAGLVRVLNEAKALLAGFASQAATVRLTGDAVPLQGTIAEAQTELLAFARQVSQARLGADAAPFWADITALRASLAAMSPLDIKVDANVAGAMAQIAALKGALADAKLGGLLDSAATGAASGGGGRGGILGFLGGLFAGKGGGKGGKGGWGSGLLTLLGFGAAASGGHFGIGAGLAGFGTLGSFAGLGPEHLLMTLTGLAGSAAGGMVGGAALGATSLGVMGVGMGTDMAGIGQAAGDVKQYTGLLNNLNQAIAVYGKGSIQAALAQYQMNQFMQDLTPAAQSAIESTSGVASSFHLMFDQMTGAAEAQGAQLLSQIMQVGEKFLPVIGQYAAQNMGIIRGALQPLFSWLQGPGLTIFTELEAKFQSDLPTAMHAFSQGVELVMRTMGMLAPETGGLIAALDRLLTRFNGADFGKWATGVQGLVDDFRRWEALIKIVGADIFQLFHADAGTAGTIVTTLTQMLQKLHAWEASTQGQASMHNLFETHKKEIEQLLKLIPPLVGTFGKLELAISPSLTQAMTLFLTGVNKLLSLPFAGTVLAWVAGFALLGSKLKLFTGLSKISKEIKGISDGSSGLGKLVTGLGNLGAAVRGLGTASATAAPEEDAAAASTSLLDVALGLMTSIGVVALAVGIYELAKHLGVMRTAMIVGAVAVAGLTVAMWALDAVPLVAVVVAIIAGLIALGVAIYELVTHWKQAWDDVKNWTEDAWHFIDHIFHDGIIGDILSVAMPLVGLATHWQQVWSDIKKWSKDAADFIDNDLVKPVVRFFTTTIPNAGKTTLDWFSALPGKIEGYFSSAITWLVNGGTNVLKGLWNGIKAAWTDGVKFFTGIAGTIEGYFSDAGSWLINAGKNIIDGLVSGIKSAIGDVGGAMSSIISKVKGFLPFSPAKEGPLSGAGAPINSGVSIGRQLAAGIRSQQGTIAAAMTAATGGSFTAALPGLSVGTGASSPQLGRIEALLSQILVEAKVNAASAKVTAVNTEATVNAARGLSSPAGVAAQIARSHAQLVTGMRAGSSR